jgi:hypothetical protein
MLNCELVASDIHPEANAFVEEQLGLYAYQSSVTPEDFHPGRCFDVIFCLSFFTHMPQRTWGRWLRSLFSQLDQGGVLVFTTSGQTFFKSRNGTPSASGLYFTSETEQFDLDTADYGFTIVTEEFVRREVENLQSAEVIEFTPDYYWTNQDLWVIRKI